VKVKPYTNYMDVFCEGEEYLLYNNRRRRHLISTVASIRQAGKHLLVRFEGYTGIEEARRLKGFEIFVHLDRLPQTGENEYYFYQVIDSEVYDDAGNYLGKVREVEKTGSANVLSIFPDNADPYEEREQEILIPMVKEYIVDFDKDKKKIVVKKPDYYSGSGN